MQVAIITTIGFSMLASISSITSTSRNIYNTLNELKSSKTYEKNKVSRELVNIDLEMNIRIMNSMINEIDVKEIKSESIIHSFESLKMLLYDIEIQLEQLNSYLNYNDSLKFLNQMRSYDCSILLKNIKENKIILDNRFNIFFKLFTIKNFLENNKRDSDSFNNLCVEYF